MEKVKRKRLGRRILSGVLSVVLTLGLMPGNVLTVKAEESTSTAPSVTAFATPEQLMSSDNFALHSDYKGVAQKVYFGKNGDSKQTWYIAGSDADNSIVLLGDPALPMETDTVFEDDPSTEKTYDSNWGCTYEAIFAEDEVVYSNHYGASDLRLSTLKALEKNTSIFTTSEQSIMQTTRVYTDDGKQRDDSSAEYTYYTEDVLYTAYGDYYDDGYITVGANSAGSLNDGLKVSLKSAPYNSGAEFWLRAPFFDVNGEHVLLARPGNSIGSNIVNVENAVVPAFRLNLSSVLFASVAPAATSGASLTDIMTFRVDGAQKIASKAAYTTDSVIVNYNETDENVFLYVQDADSVYSVEITEDTTVALASMTGIDSLTDEGTKIWLEKSEDNVAYAVMSEAVSVTHVEAKEAACEEDGNSEYWYFTVGELTFYFSDAECSDALANAPTVEAEGHNYTVISYSWNEDYTTCTASGVCQKDENHTIEKTVNTESEVTQEASCTEAGSATYTAEFEEIWAETQTKDVEIPPTGHKDDNTDGYCDACGEIADGIGAKLAGYNLSLNGNIAVNFYMELDDSVLEDDGAYAAITYPDGNRVLEKTVYVKDAETDDTITNGKTYYVFTCEVSAKDMTGDITITMHTSDDRTGKTYTYTVKDYADYIVSHPEAYSEEMIAFAKAIVNYGAYSQIYLNNKADKLANADLEAADKDVSAVTAATFESFKATVNNNAAVGSFASAYLALQTETAVNVLFKVADNVDVNDLTFKVGDRDVEAKLMTVEEVDYYLLSVENIKASNLEKKYTFTVTDGQNTSTMEYGAFSYAYTVLSGEYDDSLKNVARALWLLNQKAEAYLATKQ